MSSKQAWIARVVTAAAVLAVLLPFGVALAQPQAPVAAGGFDVMRTVRAIVDTLVFGVIGIGLLVFGYKVFGWSVPWNLNKEIEHDHNIAVAIVVGAMFLGVSVIIAAVIAS